MFKYVIPYAILNFICAVTIGQNL